MRWPFSHCEPPPAPAIGPPGAIALPDEGHLIIRAQGGDADAFGLIYERHRMAIYRYIAYRTQRQEIAEDLTADVFLNAWRAIGHYQMGDTSIRAWLLRMAHNRVIDHYRTRHPEQTLPDDGPQTPSQTGPESALDLRVDQATLLRAIRRLPAEQQQILLLRFVEGLSFEEIGGVVQKQSNACRQIQHRALARLRAALVSEEQSDG